MTDDDFFHPNRLDEVALNKFFWGQPCKTKFKALKDNPIDTHRRNPLELLAQTQDKRNRTVRSKDRQGMRMKGHHQGRALLRRSFVNKLLENSPMSDMDAIEISETDEGMW